MKYTNQEVFDKVIAHLEVQGEQALSDNKECRYRTSNGLRCAVGYLIPDDAYHPNLEGFSLGEDGHGPEQVAKVLSQLGYSAENQLLLCDLQKFHDNPDNWGGDPFSDYGQSQLLHIAEDYDLELK